MVNGQFIVIGSRTNPTDDYRYQMDVTSDGAIPISGTINIDNNLVLDKVKIRGSGIVAFPKDEDRLLDGKLFNCGNVYKNIAGAGSVGLLYAIGSKDLHLDWAIRANGNTDVEFFEGVSISASGTSDGMFNMNRTSSNTLNSDLFINPTITDSGTRLFERYILGGSGTDWKLAESELGTSTYDLLLTAGSAYWLKLTNDSGRGLILSYKGMVHEH